MILLTKSLSTLSRIVEMGYYIGKQKVSIFDYPEKEDSLIFKGKINKQKATRDMNYISCLSYVYSTKEGSIIELETSLLRQKNKEESLYSVPHQPKNNKLDSYDYLSEFKTITKDEVRQFIQLSQDPNVIHKGEEPIVPGMLLLIYIEDYLATKKIFIKEAIVTYIKPVLTEEKIMLGFKEDKIYGVVDGNRHFIIHIKEKK